MSKMDAHMIEMADKMPPSQEGRQKEEESLSFLLIEHPFVVWAPSSVT